MSDSEASAPEAHFGGMRAQCINDDFLYRVASVASDLIESANIVITSQGMTLQTIGHELATVVTVDLPAKMFDNFRCEGYTVAHINLDTFVTILKKTSKENSRFTLTLEIHSEDSETMHIEVRDDKANLTTKHVCKLWVPEVRVYEYVDLIFDSYRVVSSRLFSSTINDLAHLIDQNKDIVVRTTNDMEFSVSGEYGETVAKFEEGTTLGYKVGRQRVDPSERDEDGNYVFFNKVSGISKAMSAAVSGKKRGGKGKAAGESAAKRRKTKLADQSNADTVGEEQVVTQEEIDALAVPLDDDDALNDTALCDAPPEQLKEEQVTFGLLLLRMIAKGMQLNNEVYVLIRQNHPMVFLQKVREHGRVFIALSPSTINEEGALLGNDDAMASMMAAPDGTEE